jgi:DNA-directed RNA polymerase subunit RPC12/RpoP
LTIRFDCGNCSKAVEIEDSMADRIMECPHCSARIVAPPADYGAEGGADHDASLAELAQLNKIPCPYCGKPVKAAARKCRHCRKYIDEALKKIRAASKMRRRDSYYSRTEATRIQEQSSRALIFAIIGIFFCGIIFEPLALYTAQKALSAAANSKYPVQTGSAKAARIIAIIILVLWASLFTFGLISGLTS